jgi:hypothetical protein
VVAVSACVHAPDTLDQGKVYISFPDRGGLVREQAKELIPYEKSHGYYCISPEDLELFLIEWEHSQQIDRE